MPGSHVLHAAYPAKKGRKRRRNAGPVREQRRASALRNRPFQIFPPTPREGRGRVFRLSGRGFGRARRRGRGRLGRGRSRRGAGAAGRPGAAGHPPDRRRGGELRPAFIAHLVDEVIGCTALRARFFHADRCWSETHSLFLSRRATGRFVHAPSPGGTLPEASRLMPAPRLP